MESKSNKFWERKLELLKEEQKKGIDVRLIRDEGGYVYMMYGLKIPTPFKKGMLFMNFNSSPALVILKDGFEVPSNKVIDWRLDGYPSHLEQPIEVKRVIRQSHYWEYTYDCSICGKETRNTPQPVGTFDSRTEEELCLLCKLQLDTIRPLVIKDGEQPNPMGMYRKLLIGEDNVMWKVGNIFGYDVQRIKTIRLDGTEDETQPLAIRLGDATLLMETGEINIYQNVKSVIPIGQPIKLKPVTIIGEPNPIERLNQPTVDRTYMIKQYLENASGIGKPDKLEDLLFNGNKNKRVDNIETILNVYQSEEFNRYYTDYVKAYKVIRSSTNGKEEHNHKSIRLNLSKEEALKCWDTVKTEEGIKSILVTYKGIAFRYDKFIDDLKHLSEVESDYMGESLSDRILNLPISTEVIAALNSDKSKIKLQTLKRRGDEVKCLIEN